MTTLPMSFVRQWALTEKDKLYWEWKVIDGEMIAVVAKHEPNTFTPDLKERKSRRIPKKGLEELHSNQQKIKQ